MTARTQSRATIKKRCMLTSNLLDWVLCVPLNNQRYESIAGFVFYVLFNRISVIVCRWNGDYKKLCIVLFRTDKKPGTLNPKLGALFTRPCGRFHNQRSHLSDSFFAYSYPSECLLVLNMVARGRGQLFLCIK